MRLSPAARLGIGVVGMLLYAGILAPSIAYSAWQCANNGPGACLAPWLPMGLDLVLWAVGLPFVLLLISSRLRTGDRFELAWRQPGSGSWLLSVLLMATCLVVGSSRLSGPDNWGRSQHVLAWSSWLALGIYFGALASARGGDRDGAPGAPPWQGPAGVWMLGSGILLYTAIIGASYAEMDVASTYCPHPSVCDGPVYLMMGMMSLWLCGLPLFAILLLASVRPSGMRPWPRPEARFALLFATIPFLLLAVRAAGLSLERLLLVLFWLSVAGWLILLQHLCGRAVRAA